MTYFLCFQYFYDSICFCTVVQHRCAAAATGTNSTVGGTQCFKCYLAMPIAVKADPHWCWVNQKSGVCSVQLGRAHILLGPEQLVASTA